MTRKVRKLGEQLIKSNGLTLCFETFGRTGDPAVILIMGMGAQMIGWDEEFCQLLAGRGFFVVRFDNRDAGRSSRFDHARAPDPLMMMTQAWFGFKVEAPYLLADMAQDLVGLLDALDIGSAHLVGASMGGTIGQTVALRHPGRVLSLTSIMSTTGDRSLPQPQPWALNVLFKPVPKDLDGYVEHYVRTWKMLRVGEFPEEEQRDSVRAVRNFERGLSPAGSMRQLAAILASGSRRHELGSISIPTLVIHGDADPLVPFAAATDTARSIPGARLMVLEGVGHAMPARAWPDIVDGISNLAS